MNFRIKKIWIFKYNYLFIILVTMAVVYFLFTFLYNNLYKTIAQTDVIAVLKNEVALDNIDIQAFKQIEIFDQNRKNGTPGFLTPVQGKWINLKNPFLPYPLDPPPENPTEP